MFGACMKLFSYAMMIPLAILSLTSTAYADDVHTIKYSLEVSGEKLATFTCMYATGGQCYIKTGKDDFSFSEEHAIQSGEKIDLTLANGEKTLCFSADPEINWSSCLKGPFHIDLRKSTQGTQSYFGSSK